MIVYYFLKCRFGQIQMFYPKSKNIYDNFEHIQIKSLKRTTIFCIEN